MTDSETKVTTNLNVAAIEEKAKANLNGSLEIIGAKAIELIQDELAAASRSNKIYNIDGRAHQVSASEDMPAEYSGTLAASLKFEVDTETSHLRVFSETPYAAYLEFGTMNMAPRPFIAPVMERLEPEIQAILSGSNPQSSEPASKDTKQ